MALRDPQSSPFARVAVGTAQLGMNYGVANQTGRPSEEHARELVQSAIGQGLNWFDTAAAYGDSEAVLGRTFTALEIRDRVNVVSKGSLLSSECPSLTSQVNRSLERLCIPRLHTWLLHDEKELSAWNEKNRCEAHALLNSQRVSSFGASVYHPEQGIVAVEKHSLTAVQFPANPFDRRFLRAHVANRLARSGAQLYVRSIYLQGLCLMEPAKVPSHIFRGHEAVQTLADFCRRHGFERDQFCLHYVLQRTAEVGARLVIGVERLEQLNRNAAILSAPPIPSACLDEWDTLWPDDCEDLVLPFRWNVRA
jgi:aryl-alcohol dehydrogenase-like predicted oxidoreductase